MMGSCSYQTFASGASSIETITRPLLNGTLVPVSGHHLLKMTDLREELERLELSQYFEVLVAEGFDTWETLLDITESDLNSLNVKLGHRRKLQRAIAESRGYAHDYRPPIASSKDPSTSRKDDTSPDRKGKQGATPVSLTAGPSTKRKYRRRPKPDEHAPERPPTAYVIFSNHVRRSLKSHVLTFAEIAKIVGRRWQNLPAEAQETYQHQANAGKEKYNAKMAEYKMSPEYNAYQKYLEDFKTKHTASRRGAEDIRSKSKTQTSTSTRSSTHEYCGRSSNSLFSSDESNSFAMGHNRSESTSLVTHSLARLNSPRKTDTSSPVSASPWSGALHQEGGPFFPCSNAPEFSQALLPPVQSLEPASSALDRLAQFSSPTQQPIESRPLSSFAALLRAGELARIAHEAIDKASPP